MANASKEAIVHERYNCFFLYSCNVNRIEILFGSLACSIFFNFPLRNSPIRLVCALFVRKNVWNKFAGKRPKFGLAVKLAINQPACRTVVDVLRNGNTEGQLNRGTFHPPRVRPEVPADWVWRTFVQGRIKRARACVHGVRSIRFDPES